MTQDTGKDMGVESSIESAAESTAEPAIVEAPASIDLPLNPPPEPPIEGAIDSSLPPREAAAEPVSDTVSDIESLLELPEPTSQISGEIRTYTWNFGKKIINAFYEVLGEGSPILLLPAFSTISSRNEMRRLAEHLAQKHQVYLLDWPGFGESDRPKVPYTPKFYHAFLRSFVQETFSAPIVVIASGHAAGYVMELARSEPKPWSWVVLTAPTWRGPLPTMMGNSKRKGFRIVQELVNLPIVGQLLYWLNTRSLFLKWMMRRHVYGQRSFITPALMREKRQATKGRGARFASAAFVTGALDPVRSSQDWLNYFQPLPLPVLMVIGEQMPPKSRGEAEVVAHFCGVQVLRTEGSLGLVEEQADQIFEGIAPFLEKYLSKRA